MSNSKIRYTQLSFIYAAYVDGSLSKYGLSEESSKDI